MKVSELKINVEIPEVENIKKQLYEVSEACQLAEKKVNNLNIALLNLSEILNSRSLKPISK